MSSAFNNNKHIIAMRDHSFIVYFLSFFSVCIAYRIYFVVELLNRSYTLTAYLPYTLLGLLNDLIPTVILASTFVICKKLFKLNLRSFTLRFIFYLILYATLACVVSLYVAYQKLFFDFHFGLSYDLIVSFFNTNVTFRDGLHYLSSTDFKFIFLSLYLFVLFQNFPVISLKNIFYYLLMPMILVLMLYGMVSNAFPLATADRLTFSNPLYFVFKSQLESSHGYYASQKDQPTAAQRESVRLIDPAFVFKTTDHPSRKTTPTHPWNVVIIVLESVGATYAFDQRYQAMPFLNSLKKQSLWLNNNYSSGNNSPIALFSIFTGIYPDPTPSNFVLKPNLFIPTLSTWLGKNYDTFLVSPYNSNFFFPKGIFTHDGVMHFYDVNNLLEVRHNTQGFNGYLNEIETFNFFISRINQAKKPFFAVYYSGLAHFPYFDYGPAYRLMPTIADPYARYMNNLNLLDQKLKDLYVDLKKKNLLNNTIIVITGDHGEGFNQHFDDVIHGAALYQEQVTVPTLIYQPKLFKPRVMNEPTSQVDILPTILEAMHIPYNDNNIQGESLLGDALKRKYIFIYNYANGIAAIDSMKNKMIISYAHNTCEFYRLKQDPNELHPLACTDSSYTKAIIKFRNYQHDMLIRFNNKQMAMALKRYY